MISFSLHPNVYNTHKTIKGVLNMLETVWVRSLSPGDGTIYVISGFANYNGGVRFYDLFENHIKCGGKLVVVLGGSTSQRLSSQQVVEQLIKVGAEVYIVNRKRLLHAKCYGYASSTGQSLIVTSANFTGPGMSQNVEASLMLDENYTQVSGFQWNELLSSMLSQNWDISRPNLLDLQHPTWKLLYNEIGAGIKLDDTQEMTLLVTLSHSDTARIQANPGDTAGKGTQYFWLSKDSFDFFPPLTIRNERGYKATYSALVNMNYIDAGFIDSNCRITFEADNNLDFRLGTGALRYSKLASQGDIAAISRVGEVDYQLRIIPKGNQYFNDLLTYANTFIGNQGKRCGYISNHRFGKMINIKL
jgi:Metal-independent restriction enzyme BfiI DNA binding domain/PLD-like domain